MRRKFGLFVRIILCTQFYCFNINRILSVAKPAFLRPQQNNKSERTDLNDYESKKGHLINGKAYLICISAAGMTYSRGIMHQISNEEIIGWIYLLIPLNSSLQSNLFRSWPTEADGF